MNHNAVKRKASERCNLEENKVRRPMGHTEKLNKKKAFSFSFEFYHYKSRTLFSVWFCCWLNQGSNLSLQASVYGCVVLILELCCYWNGLATNLKYAEFYPHPFLLKLQL